MASFIDAVCECGLRCDGLLVGMRARLVHQPSGRPQFQAHGTDWQPASCRACGIVVSVGWPDPRICPGCAGPVQFFNEPAMYEIPEARRASFDRARWEAERPDQGLLAFSFACPRCQQVRLRLLASPLGCID